MDKDTSVYLVPGVVEYDVPQDCDAVIDVTFPASITDISLSFAPNFLSDDQLPASVFSSPNAAGPYGTLVQVLQHNEMAKRILGIDRNWIFYPYKKKLLITPNPKGGGVMVIEYKSNLVTDIQELPERDHDLIKRFALAYARRDLGEIYSRYSTWPTAVGPQALNGSDLIQRALKEFEILEEEIANSAMPMPFLTG